MSTGRAARGLGGLVELLLEHEHDLVAQYFERQLSVTSSGKLFMFARKEN